MSVLLDSSSEVNAIHPVFAKEQGFSIRPIDVGVQKIDSTTLETYGIVVAAFSIEDKANQVKIFKETFLVANISPEVVYRIPFLTLSSANIDFLGRELRWRTYTTKETFSTTRRIELVGKKKFAATTLDPESEILIVLVVSFSSNALPSFSPLKLNFYPSCRPQVSNLIAEEALTKVLIKYLDFTDVFSPDLASDFPEHTRINNHAIKLVDGQQPPYGLIYNLKPVELKTLNAYIKTNPINRFIKPSKSVASAPILFDRKSDSSLRLWVNYRASITSRSKTGTRCHWLESC